MKVMLKDKVWDEDAVKHLIDTNDQAVARALLVVYANQTADERSAGITKHHNGVGFTAQDAAWLSDVAVKWKRWQRWASERQCNAVRKAIRKYHRQILQHMLDTNEGAVLVTRGMQPPVQQQPAQTWSLA